MTAAEVFKKFNDTWENALPSKRLEQAKILRSFIPSDHLDFFDSLLDAKLANVQDDPNQVRVLLVHGIQTDGAWQKHVEKSLNSSYIKVKGLGYDCVTPLQLAFPWRSGPIDKIIREVRDVKSLEPNAKLMVIAHSFGSYIVSKILSHHPDIKFERIILCGSIISTNYRWDIHARSMIEGSVLNDVGTRDFYPVLATFSTFGYGSSGRKGFQNIRVKDRYFNYGHSDFFETKYDHIVKYWKPFIEEGSIVESEWDTTKPKTSIPILMLSHPWIGRSIFYLLLLLAVAYFSPYNI